MTYKKLDITQDPGAQGLELQSYDLIIASNVLHATPDISVTLRNVQSLLKDGGKLALLELTQQPSPYTMPFAMLPGWWLANDGYRSSQGPLLSATGWDSVLRTVGFSGVEGHMSDFPGEPEENFAVMWSTKVPAVAHSSPQNSSICICRCAQETEYTAFAETVSATAGSLFELPTRVQDFVGMETDSKPLYIVLDSPHRSIFNNTSAEQFQALKDFFCHAHEVLWVSFADAEPESALAKGFLRGMRLEDTSRSLFLLENIPRNDTGSAAIARVAQYLNDPSADTNSDQEFVFVDGLLQVPRLRARTTAKDVFAIEAGFLVKEKQAIGSSKDALDLSIESIGNPDSIYFRNAGAPSEPPGEDEVVIRVEAVGVNFRDLLLVLGSIPWHSPGLEGAGKVVAAGSHVKDLRVGDRVLSIAPRGGGMCNFIRLHTQMVHKMPDGLDTVNAATLPIAYSTAIMSLVNIARLQRGESVLIHAASGAVGQACIMLAQHIGAEIFATAGTEKKRTFLSETYHIPPNRIFSSRTAKFRDAILRETNNAGVNVIVNSLSGTLLKRTWEVIAEYGRFVELGKKDFLQNNSLPMRPFDRNSSFSGLDLHSLCAHRPQDVKACLALIVRMFSEKSIAPIRPVTVIPISQVTSGLRQLQSGQNIGKIVLTIEPDDVVEAERPSPLGSPSQGGLKQDKTYIITGGTGGIGRSLAAWMVREGARNIILLGKSGSSNPKVSKLLKQYEGTNIRMRAIACDVGSRGDLVRAAGAITDLPPVGDVIHGALYLRVSPHGPVPVFLIIVLTFLLGRDMGQYVF